MHKHTFALFAALSILALTLAGCVADVDSEPSPVGPEPQPWTSDAGAPSSQGVKSSPLAYPEKCAAFCGAGCCP
jgi:hypothetical protein